MIATVTLNPALDKSIFVDTLLPHDTNRVLKVEVDAGGKGINVSRVLKELGDDTITLGFLGGQTGRFIEHTLTTEGIRTDFTRIKADTRTNISIQESSGAPPTSLNEPGPSITDDELDELIANVRKEARKSPFIVFGGSLPPQAPVDIYKRLIAVAKGAGAKVILDSDGEPMCKGLQAAPYMIKPNRDEVHRLVDVDIKSIDDAKRALNLLTSFGVKVVVISMGAKGAVASSEEGMWYAQPPQVKVISTIGSGDSMVAGIVHILKDNGSLDEALRWGTAAGAATAMTGGTEISKRSRIIELLDKVEIEQIG
ncbi:MAG: 1-phosphofructokinase [Armatimonadota bacterium]